ncbi:MAG: hypothetical protein H6R10_431 [Rhodocyclaceae bacterium]|nr:hypothetical protein [Rhodocyclaceae bacterium]
MVTAKPSAAVLRVGIIDIAPPFDGRALVYRRDDVRFETDFYNQFAVDPDAMVAVAVTEWLGQSGLFRQVVPWSAAAATDYRLEAQVPALYVDFRQEPPAVLLEMHWQLLRESDRSRVLAVDCRERVALAERSPAGAARAYREALRRALARLEAALAAASI